MIQAPASLDLNKSDIGKAFNTHKGPSLSESRTGSVDIRPVMFKRSFLLAVTLDLLHYINVEKLFLLVF